MTSDQQIPVEVGTTSRARPVKRRSFGLHLLTGWIVTALRRGGSKLFRDRCNVVAAFPEWEADLAWLLNSHMDTTLASDETLKMPHAADSIYHSAYDRVHVRSMSPTALKVMTSIDAVHNEIAAKRGTWRWNSHVSTLLTGRSISSPPE